MGESPVSSIAFKAFIYWPFPNSLPPLEMVPLGSFVTITTFVVACRAFWCQLPSRFANTAMRLGYLGSCWDYYSILLVPLWASHDLLRGIGLAPNCWILCFHIARGLARYFTWLKLRQCYVVWVPWWRRFTCKSSTVGQCCSFCCPPAAFEGWGLH